MSPDLGPVVRRFSYDSGGVGLFLLGILAAPLLVMGVLAAVVLPLTAGRGQPLDGAGATVMSAISCLLVTVPFGYLLWSAYQVSGYRNGVYTVHEGGLTHQTRYDAVHGLPAGGITTIAWTDVVEVHVEQRPARVRWLLPPNLRYRAAVVVDEGWALVFTGATRDAPVLAAMVRGRAGLTGADTWDRRS
jgi:hypothetical protein